MDTSKQKLYRAPGTSPEVRPGSPLGGPYREEREEALDPEIELEYWREAFFERPYYDPDYTFEAYEPAYRYGWESRSRMLDRDWDEAEEELRREWMKSKPGRSLTWERAKEAVRDAWERLTGNEY